MADSSGFGLGNSQDMMYYMALSQMGGGQGGGQGLGFDPMMFVDPRTRMKLGMAQSMMQQGMSTAPALTPLAGLSRLGAAILGRGMMSDLYSGQQQDQGQQPATSGQLSPTDQALKSYLSPADWNIYSNLPNNIEKLNWRLKTLPAIQEARAAPQHLAPNEKIIYGPDGGPRIVSDLPITDIAKMASDRDAALQRGDTRTWAALNTQIAEAAANKGWPVSQDAQGNVHYQAPTGPAAPSYAGDVAGAQAAATYQFEIGKIRESARASALEKNTTIQVWNPNANNGAGSWENYTVDQNTASTLAGGGIPEQGGGPPTAPTVRIVGGSEGSQGATGPAGGAGTAAGGGSATGAAAPPAATGNAPAATGGATGNAPASTTPTPPTQAPPPTSAEKNVTPIVQPTQGAGGSMADAIDKGLHAGERTAPGQVGAAGEQTSYQITSGAAQAVGMAVPKTEAEGRAVAQAYMAQNLRRFPGRPDLAFAAYNWGPNAVANWVNRGSDPAKMPQAVKDYVQRAMAAYTGAAGGAPATTTAPAPTPQQDIPQQVLPPEETPVLPATAGGPGWAVPMPMLRPGGAAQPTPTPTPAPTPAQTTVAPPTPPSSTQGQQPAAITSRIPPTPVYDPNNAQYIKDARADLERQRTVANGSPFTKENVDLINQTMARSAQGPLSGVLQDMTRVLSMFGYSGDDLLKQYNNDPNDRAALQKVFMQLAVQQANLQTGGGHTGQNVAEDFMSTLPNALGQPGSNALMSNVFGKNALYQQDRLDLEGQYLNDEEAAINHYGGTFKGLDGYTTADGVVHPGFQKMMEKEHNAHDYLLAAEIETDPKLFQGGDKEHPYGWAAINAMPDAQRIATTKRVLAILEKGPAGSVFYGPDGRPIPIQGGQ